MRGRKCHAEAFGLRKIRDSSVMYLRRNRIEGSIIGLYRATNRRDRINLSKFKSQVSSLFLYENSPLSSSSTSVLKIVIKKYVRTTLGIIRAHWSLRSLVQPLIDASCYCLSIPRKCLREMHGPCEMICTIGNDKALDKSYKSDGLAVFFFFFFFVINWSISCALIGAFHTAYKTTALIHGSRTKNRKLKNLSLNLHYESNLSRE